MKIRLSFIYFVNFTARTELFEKDVFYEERENQNAVNQCSVLISVLC